MIGERFNQKNANVITWAKVEAIKVPTLLMTGEATCGRHRRSCACRRAI